MEGKTNKIVVILGRKGCGKTYIASKLAVTLAEAGRRVICVAPMGDFEVPGAVVIRDGYPESYLEVGDRSVVALPSMIGGAETAAAAIAFASGVGNCWLFVDEIHQHLPCRGNQNPVMKKILQFGRHNGISLVGISQRPAMVDKELIAGADEKIIFQIAEPGDLAYLSFCTGLDRNRLMGLEPRQYFRIKNS